MSTLPNIDLARLDEVRARGLEEGKHATPAKGLCAMEAVAYIMGGPHTDAPATLCPVIGAYVRRLNDAHVDFRIALMDKLTTICGGERNAALEPARLKVFGEAAADIADLAVPIFEARFPNDDRARRAAAIARRLFVDGPTLPAAEREALRKEAREVRDSLWASWRKADAYADAYADAAYAADADAAYAAAAYAAYAAAAYAAYAAAAYAADAAYADAAYAAYALRQLRAQVVERCMRALDDALAVRAA